MSVSTPEFGGQPALPWGETTDPAHHDPAQFRYLVHAINPYSSMSAGLIRSYDSRTMAPDENWGDQSISMYDWPERVAERVSLSMSLVDQDHTITWGDAGLIIEAPTENIVLAQPFDVGSHNNNLDFLLEQAKMNKTMRAEALLKGTATCSYNEVLAIASHNDRQLQVKGFFYKTTAAGEPFSRPLANRMQSHANRLGLPLVAWIDPSRRLALTFNNSQYSLDDPDIEQRFRVSDEVGRIYFAAPQEFQSALDSAVESGRASQEQAKKITQSYLEVDRRRRTPTATFDDKGNFEQIVFHEGYGADEYKVSLYKSGHGYRVNVALQIERNQEAMLNIGKPLLVTFSTEADRASLPLNPDEVEKIVEQACEQLDEAQTSLVHQWYAKYREVVQEQWNYHTQSLGKIGLGEFEVPHLDVLELSGHKLAADVQSPKLLKDFYLQGLKSLDFPT